MFGPFIIMYLFLGGCGAGMLFVSSLWSIVFHRRADRTYRESAAFRTCRNRCFAAGVVIVCLGALCLLADLGRPERFVLLFFRPNETYLTFGTFVLTLLIVVGLFLAVSNHFYLPRVTTRAKAVAEALCVVSSLAVMAYTGLFFAGALRRGVLGYVARSGAFRPLGRFHGNVGMPFRCGFPARFVAVRA